MTQGYLCMLEKVLYPIDKLHWCVYVLFMEVPEITDRDCMLDFEDHISNHATSLDGWLWVMTSLVT